MPKKYLSLEDTRVYYDYRTGSIRLISKDHRLRGKPFQVNLVRDSSSAESIYRLLEAEGLIDAELDDLPKTAKLSSSKTMDVVDYDAILGSNSDPRLRFVLGQTFKEKMLGIDLSHAPHTLIGGGTGSGKTALLGSIIAQILARPATELRYISLGETSEIPSFTPQLRTQDAVARSLSNALAMLKDLDRTIERRLGIMASEETIGWFNAGYPLVPIFLAIDDIDHIVAPTPGDSDLVLLAKQEINRRIGNILRVGRPAGIYATITGHRLDTSIIPGEHKANIGRRILMGPADPATQAMVMGTAIGHGKELLWNQGRGIVRTYSSQPRVFQAFRG